MDNKEIVDILLQYERVITNKIHTTISEILSKDYSIERSISVVNGLQESIGYSLEEMDELIKRK